MSAASDLAVSSSTAYIVTNNGSSFNTIHRYDISGSAASLIATSALTTGPSSVAMSRAGDAVYASKGGTLYSFYTDLQTLSSSYSAAYSITRLAYGGDSLFYLSSTGRFVRTLFDGSDTTVATGGPLSSAVRGLAASADGSALYYASNSAIGKISVTGATTLWTKSISDIAGMDINQNTGAIHVITTSGVVTAYSPINPVSGVSASASGSSIALSWNTDVLDTDFRGVTIRRSMSDYPASVTDGVAVTSSLVSTSFTDTDLSAGTYYYSIFNQTADGYYGGAATSTATVDLPPDAPTLSAAVSGSSVQLSWSVPADTDSFTLRHSMDGYPSSHADGTAVTSTTNSVTNITLTGQTDGTHYYSLFAADAGGNYSSAGTAVATVDTTGPNAPTLLANASGTTIALSWDVPATTDSFLLRRSSVGFPASITDGTAVTTTVNTSFIETDLSDGTYYYSLFARDSYDNPSAAGTASSIIDTVGPSAPGGFSATVNNNSIYLAWSNPLDTDFARITIRRSASSFPTDASDGTAIASTTETGYTDTALNDGTYYYSIFAIDTIGNASTRATTSAAISTPVVSSGGAVGASNTPIPLHGNIIFFGLDTPKESVDETVSNSSADNPTKPTTPNPTQASPTALYPFASLPKLRFQRNLRHGDRGADMKALQAFLNANGFFVAKSGPGSPGRETTFFGAATANAVKRFQEAYKSVVLQPYGLKQGTGIFGAKMRELVQPRR